MALLCTCTLGISSVNLHGVFLVCCWILFNSCGAAVVWLVTIRICVGFMWTRSQFVVFEASGFGADFIVVSVRLDSGSWEWI